jgi:hypothetical protein
MLGQCDIGQSTVDIEAYSALPCVRHHAAQHRRVLRVLNHAGCCGWSGEAASVARKSCSANCLRASSVELLIQLSPPGQPSRSADPRYAFHRQTGRCCHSGCRTRATRPPQTPLAASLACHDSPRPRTHCTGTSHVARPSCRRDSYDSVRRLVRPAPDPPYRKRTRATAG